MSLDEGDAPRSENGSSLKKSDPGISPEQTPSPSDDDGVSSKTTVFEEEAAQCEEVTAAISEGVPTAIEMENVQKLKVASRRVDIQTDSVLVGDRPATRFRKDQKHIGRKNTPHPNQGSHKAPEENQSVDFNSV